MTEEHDFFIDYNSEKVKVTSMLNEANIHFLIHLKTPVIISEVMENEDWVWHQQGQGETVLAAEIGAILEAMEI